MLVADKNTGIRNYGMTVFVKHVQIPINSSSFLYLFTIFFVFVFVRANTNTQSQISYSQTDYFELVWTVLIQKRNRNAHYSRIVTRNIHRLVHVYCIEILV